MLEGMCSRVYICWSALFESMWVLEGMLVLEDVRGSIYVGLHCIIRGHEKNTFDNVKEQGTAQQSTASIGVINVNVNVISVNLMSLLLMSLMLMSLMLMLIS